MFREIYQQLSSTGRDFILIGGHALAAYGVFRHTVDVDFMINDVDCSVFVDCLTKNGWEMGHFSDLAIRLTNGSGEILDFVLVDGKTFTKVLQDGKTVTIDECQFPVPSLKMLMGMKVHALSNAPEHFLKDGTDVVALLTENQQPFVCLREICDQYGTPEVLEKLRFLYECQ